jgi:transcriptional regulator with XRE-family HTH domain
MNKTHYDNEALKQRARDKGLTYTQIAERCGVKRLTVHRAMNGDVASYELLSAISDILDSPVTEFLYPRPAHRKKFADDVSKLLT